MRWVRAAGLSLILAIVLLACSTPPSNTSGGGEKPVAVEIKEPPATPKEPPLTPAPRSPVEVRFHLFDGPTGFKLPDLMHVFKPGDRAITGAGSVDLDIVFKGVGEAVARQALQVQGGRLRGEPQWLPDGGLGLQLEPGKAGETVTVTIKLPNTPPAVLTLARAAQATVEVDQRYGNMWKPVAVLDANAPPGAAEVRLTFSKPVRRQEVEKALTATQSALVRGLMTWGNDQTLIWQIAELPPRLDFLLGGAHDQDGLPLPGGIPSLRVGEPPIVVEVNLASPADLARATLPPDILSATLTPDLKHINLKVWSPGTSPWDWQRIDLNYDFATKDLKSGWFESVQPRLPADLDDWVMSPQGTAVAGLRMAKPQQITKEPVQSSLVILDLRGGRQAVYEGFISKFQSPNPIDLSTAVAWSADGQKVAALSYKGPNAKGSDLVMLDLLSGNRTILHEDLPVPAFGTRLSWSPSGRYLLAGNLLVDLQIKTYTPLQGDPTQARGAWERGGRRLMYGVQDWGQIFIIDPVTGEGKPLGTGFLVDWPAPDRVYIVRWPASGARYLPPGL